MKTISSALHAITLAVIFACTSTGVARAQTAPVKAPEPANASDNKSVTKASIRKKAAPSASRIELRSTAKNMAAGIEAAEDALTPSEIAIAERVYVGQLPCELGASVSLVADAKAPGYFNLQGKNFKYRMFPVPTTTGTIRLEDRQAGAVWLQMGNKSMLMNQKLGTRLADECTSPAQLAMAEALKLNPAPSVLDAPKPAASAALALGVTGETSLPTISTTVSTILSTTLSTTSSTTLSVTLPSTVSATSSALTTPSTAPTTPVPTAASTLTPTTAPAAIVAEPVPAAQPASAVR